MVPVTLAPGTWSRTIWAYFLYVFLVLSLHFNHRLGKLFSQLSPLFSKGLVSWNGYEHNALLMNQDGKGFLNVGYLMGAGFEQAMVLTVASLSTTGPLIELATDFPIRIVDLSAGAKLTMCAAMVIGRLETLAIIALITPSLWRD